MIQKIYNPHIKFIINAPEFAVQKYYFFFFKFIGFQTVATVPLRLVLPGNLLEMKIFRPHPRCTDSKKLEEGSEI